MLYACSHGGLVEEGRRIFHSLTNEYGVSPKHEHFGWMVDLFGPANLLSETLEVIEAMPFAPPNAHLGQGPWWDWVRRFAAKQVLKLEPDHNGALVVLSNLYAEERRWEDVGEVRKVMNNKMGVSIEGGGRSRIGLINEVHELQMADRSKQIKYITN